MLQAINGYLIKKKNYVNTGKLSKLTENVAITNLDEPESIKTAIKIKNEPSSKYQTSTDVELLISEENEIVRNRVYQNKDIYMKFNLHV